MDQLGLNIGLTSLLIAWLVIFKGLMSQGMSGRYAKLLAVYIFSSLIFVLIPDQFRYFQWELVATAVLTYILAQVTIKEILNSKCKKLSAVGCLSSFCCGLIVSLIVTYTQDTPYSIADLGGNTLNSVVVLVIISPIFEEIGFRGYLTPKEEPSKTDVVSAALLFAAVHSFFGWRGLIVSLVLFFLAIFLHLIRTKYGLVASMMAHACYNSGVIFCDSIFFR